MISKDFKFIQPGGVRTRFAPAPTGPLHIGSARTALFNYLFAKKYQGSFILRIEDTDIERSDPQYIRDIIESLNWLGIEWNEGPIAYAQNQKSKIKNQKYIGECGPYRQSERIPIYAKYLEKLLAEGKAYHCFCSEEELEDLRQYQMSIGEPPRYTGKCLQLSPRQVEKYLAEGKKSVIRFKIPPKKIKFKDLIRGELEFDASLFGDIVIAKNLPLTTFQEKSLAKGTRQKVVGGFLYNFTVVIDDFEMRISQVIRGEDLLPNTPKQILIQEALGFLQPEYAHLPLILGPDKTKLSKRHGAIAIAEYKKAGYLPEAVINFIAFLGWNPGDEREIYSLPSLIKEFSLERVQKGGAVFNIKRLDFLNGFYIRQRSLGKLTELCLPYLIEAGLIEKIEKEIEFSKKETEFRIKETKELINFETLQKIISIYQERLKKISEIPELIDFFFKEKLEYNKELLRWREMNSGEILDSLDRLEKILSKIKLEDFNKENLERLIMPEAERMGDRGYLLWPLRVALTGKRASAGPFEIAEILGKEKILKRIKEAKNK